MQCSEQYPLFNRYLDGDLSADETNRLLAHMAECDACRAAWEAMEWVSSTLASEPMATPAAGFSSRVAARIQTRDLHQRWVYSIVGLSTTAVGLWMLALFVVLSIGTAAWPSVVRTTLFVASLQVVRGAVNLVWVLAGALRAVGTVLYAHSGATALVGYAVLSGIVVLSWTEIVLRRRIPAWLRV